MADNLDGAQPIIIIKKVKGGHGGHHGGAWKVAYADFVTAMMAFFLLMWLLNASTEEQLAGISNYFAPDSISRTTSGSGGLMGGKVNSESGAMANAQSAPGVSVPLSPPRGDPNEGEIKDLDNDGNPPPAEASEPWEEASGVGPDGQAIDEEAFAELKARIEEQQFAEAEQALRQSIRDDPELEELRDSLIIDQTEEGLRIQLVDQEKYSMFASGSAKLAGHTKKMLQQVARVVAKMSNRIAIAGHTDATRYSADSKYDNWELSADRANASRRALIDAGLPPSRIERVVGRADQEPLLKHDPTNPRNRRISITLLRINEMPAKTEDHAKPAEPAAPAAN